MIKVMKKREEEPELDYMISDEEYGITEEQFRDMPLFEQKRFLCNALGVATYYSDEELREKLEPIINAR